MEGDTSTLTYLKNLVLYLQVQEHVRREFIYQSSMELADETFDLVRNELSISAFLCFSLSYLNIFSSRCVQSLQRRILSSMPAKIWCSV